MKKLILGSVLILVIGAIISIVKLESSLIDATAVKWDPKITEPERRVILEFIENSPGIQRIHIRGDTLDRLLCKVSASSLGISVVKVGREDFRLTVDSRSLRKGSVTLIVLFRIEDVSVKVAESIIGHS